MAELQQLLGAYRTLLSEGVYLIEHKAPLEAELIHAEAKRDEAKARSEWEARQAKALAVAHEADAPVAMAVEVEQTVSQAQDLDSGDLMAVAMATPLLLANGAHATAAAAPDAPTPHAQSSREPVVTKAEPIDLDDDDVDEEPRRTVPEPPPSSPAEPSAELNAGMNAGVTPGPSSPLGGKTVARAASPPRTPAGRTPGVSSANRSSTPQSNIFIDSSDEEEDEVPIAD
eukprot:6212228-Pleurochrysis_carterae.AAC.1